MIIKKKNIFKFLSHLIKKHQLSVVAFVALLSLVSVFTFTKGKTPHTSELSYVEHSVYGKAGGSVVPASCDTNTPHDGEICGNWVANGSCPAWYLCGQPARSLPYVCQGANTSPGCFGSQPADLQCPASPSCVPTVKVAFGQLPATPRVTVSVSTTKTDVLYGTTPARISWESENAASCYIETIENGVTLSGYPQPPTGSYTTAQWTGSQDRTRTYKVSCANGTAQSIVYGSVSVTDEGGYYGGGGGGCFTAGTKVLMADGTYKNIEAVTLEDSIMTSGGPQEVMKAYHIKYKGLLYAFNGNGNYFVTPTHPFMTPQGWKSLDPAGTRKESKGIIVSQLAVGDTLIMKDGKTMKLTQLDSKVGETMVYNFGVNGTHDFYADNYLVHNVDMGIIFQKAYAANKN